MMRVYCDDTGDGFIWRFRRNVSISPVGLLYCFAGLSAVTLGIASVFAWLGVWWVLPFAGLESVALACAFSYMAIHASDFEEVVVSGDSVCVAVQNAWFVRQSEYERSLVRVVWMGAIGSERLWLSCRDDGVEIGRLLDDAERRRLAQMLTRRLKF